MQDRAAKMAERRRLYDLGLSDRQVAARQGLDCSTILGWRKRQGLPPRKAHTVLPWEEEKRLALYKLRWSDGKIAKECGCHPTSIYEWRKSRNLPAHVGDAALTLGRKGPKGKIVNPARHAKMLELYHARCSDAEVARQVGIFSQSVYAWRKRNGLPRIAGKKLQAASRPKAARTPFNPMQQSSLFRRISRALGRGLAPDILADAAAEMLLALADGSLSEDQIEAQASRYRNKTIGAYASQWGPASLDEDRGRGEDEFSLYELIEDEGQLDAMHRIDLEVLAERMGIELA